MKKLLKNPTLLIIGLLLILIVPAFADTIKPGYFSMHDDLQVMRQLVMEKCFRDGQIPCRWSEDMGYGYGYPLFNYYPPLPYYFGEVFRLFGLPFVDTVKVLVALSFIASGLLMYLLAQEFWGRWGGLLSALLYVYAPYHAVDVYVRGAMNETWALVFLPAIFWSLYKLVTTNKWFYVPWLALSVAFLMLSHNPILMIFAPFALVWTIFWFLQNRNTSVFPKLLTGALWAVGLAAFFTVPVIAEQKDVYIETIVMGYFNYLAHFASIDQLFISRFWGYGASILGTGDGMSFQVGYLHWGLGVVSLLAAALTIRQNKRISLMIGMVFLITLFYTFMVHEKSSPIWKLIPPLEYLQFPWRFLTLSIFGTSLLGGSIIWILSKTKLKKMAFILTIIFVLGAIALYGPYFRWDKHWPWVSDQVKLSGELWKLQTTNGIYDYLPKSVPIAPGGPPFGDIEMLKGKGEIKKVVKNSVRQEYKVSAKEDVSIHINTFYFPGWKYYVNGKEIKLGQSEGVISLEAEKDLGRPLFKMPPGEYSIALKFTNTPVRIFGNIVSLASWGLLLFIAIRFMFRR